MFLLKNDTHRMVIRHDSQIGHKWIKNQVARIPHENGGYLVRTNSQGFRSDFDFETKKGKKPRILVFGDSYTAGDGVNNNQRFSDLLGESINAEVYNFGLSGSGTDQQLLIYENYAKEVEADLIVIATGVENINRIKVQYRPSIDRTTGKTVYVPKPYFSLDAEGQLELHNVPVPNTRPESLEGEGTSQSREDVRRSNPMLKPIYELADVLKKQPQFDKFGRLISPSENIDHNRIRSNVLKMMKFDPYPDYRDKQGDAYRLMEQILKRFMKQVYPTPVLL
ncbi:SGNH/GDSL hydrolase family protein, partial [bacterium]|nr:SGNH/GDSL hydrolase family protein [bacterium]